MAAGAADENDEEREEGDRREKDEDSECDNESGHGSGRD